MPTPGIRVLLIGFEEKLPYLVSVAKDPGQILPLIATTQPDVIVSSPYLPSVLNTAALEIRRRWIHPEPGATRDLLIQAIENCYAGNLWGDHHLSQKFPLVSVYTGTYNSGWYLRETFQSLLDQEYKNWEWVVVDDHSSDKTWEALLHYASEDIRVKPIRVAKHLGKIGAVKDMATRLCAGKYLVELDHDDMLTDVALSEIVKAFAEHPDVGMVYSNCANFFEDGSAHRYNDAFWKDRYRPFTYRGKEYLECLQPNIYDRFGDKAEESYAWFLTVGPNHVRAYRAQTLRELGGYNPKLMVADDWDVFARFFLFSKCHLIEKPIYLYRFKDAHTNTTFKHDGFSWNKAIQAHLKLGQNHYYEEFKKANAKRLKAGGATLAPEVPAHDGNIGIVVATRKMEDVAALTLGLLGSAHAKNLHVVAGADSIFDAYEDGRLRFKHCDRIIYIHDDVQVSDWGKFIEMVKALPPGLHGPVGSRNPSAGTTESPYVWWEQLPFGGRYIQGGNKPVDYGSNGEKASYLDGFLLVAVNQEWSWKPAGAVAQRWHGYDWLAACRARKSGGGSRIFPAVEGLTFSHQGLGREEGVRESIQELAALEKAALPPPVDFSSQISYVVIEAAPTPLTEKCLQSIRKHSPKSEIILVSNGMTQTLGTLCDKGLQFEANLGFAAAANAGARAASRPILVFMNNDACLVDDETPKRMFEAMGDKHPIVGPYSNRAKPPQGDVPQEAAMMLPDAYQDMVVGLCMMVPKKIFFEIGGFDPRFLTYDDDDFCKRAAVLGYFSKVAGKTWVQHARHETFRLLNLDPNQVMKENKARFEKKYPKIRVIVIAKDEEAAIRGFMKQWVGVADEVCILMDSTTTDKTNHVLSGAGMAWKCDTFDFTDFASARNEAVKRFGDGADWIVMFDPDERLDEHTLRHLRELLATTKEDILLAPLEAVFPAGERRQFVTKVFAWRNKPEIKWVFKVHEKLIGSRKQAIVRNALLTHEMNLHDPERRKKAEGLYRKLMSEEPYFTDPVYKKKICSEWPILDYDHKDDDRLKSIYAGPLISVVIPTYKRLGLLIRAIDSVLHQDYPNVDVIVVGDACPELKFMQIPPAQKDDRVRILNLTQNFGAGGAVPRNHGIYAAAGEIIAYLDDDNYFRGDHLSSLCEAMRHADAAYGISSMTLDGLGEDLKFEKPEKGSVDTSCLLHRKSLIWKYGPWKSREGDNYAHDWEIVSRWKGEKWTVTGLPTVIYNVETCGQKEYLAEIVANKRATC